jgi:dihydroflavonol-4-reductase
VVNKGIAMKALVTGGTGFVGSHVARALADAGHSVRVLHRPSSKLTALEGIAYEHAPGDILDAPSLRAACEGCDWVFHVAAVADYWRASTQAITHANVDGTRMVLAAAYDAGVKRVVFTSSAAARGLRHDGRPADERVMFNQLPLRFPYGYSKALAEVVCREAVAAGQDIVIVNPVVVMGPGDLNRISGELILSVAQWGPAIPVPPGGVAVTDVRDIARWHVRAAEQGEKGERYLLGTDNVPHADLFALIAAVANVPRPGFPVPGFLLPPLGRLVELARSVGLPIKVDGMQIALSGKEVYFTFDKAWQAFGPPEYTLRQTIQDAYDWYAAHGYIERSAWMKLITR